MIFSLTRKRNTPLDIPFQSNAAARLAPWAIGTMTFLAALALGAVFALSDFEERWRVALAKAVTVQLPPAAFGSETITETTIGQESRMARILAVLISEPGVLDARALSQSDMIALIKPWLGEDIGNGTLPLPRIITIVPDLENPPDLDRLRLRLMEEAPEARLNDQGLWRVKILSFLDGLTLIAAGCIAVAALAAGMITVLVTLAGLANHRQAIDLLHLIGAQDRYIARQIQSQVEKISLFGGFAGLLVAGVIILIVGHGLSLPTPPPLLVLGPVHWFFLLLLPIAITGLASLTTRLTVMQILREVL